MGQLLQFPNAGEPSTISRVATAIAGDVPLWQATAEVFGSFGIRHVSCTLVQPEPGHLDLLHAVIEGNLEQDLPSDVCIPDPRWGDVAPALLGLWLEIPSASRHGLGLHLVRAGGTVGALSVQAVLTVGPTGVRSALWTAYDPTTRDLEIHGRLAALAP